MNARREPCRNPHLLHGTEILELSAGKDETLVLWWNAFRILNRTFQLSHHRLRDDFESFGPARQSLHEDLQIGWASLMKVGKCTRGSVFFEFVGLAVQARDAEPIVVIVACGRVAATAFVIAATASAT